jgi:L-lactate dehydrogenase complex protein LldG
VSIAREEILGRVRVALGAEASVRPDREASAPVAAASADRRTTEAAQEDLVTRFVERVTEYGATVRSSRPAEVAATVAVICAEQGVERLICPADLPHPWRPPAIEKVSDDPTLSADELDRADGVLTGCAFAAAETGTLALDHGPRQGRRALTLLPDLHICVVEVTQLVPDIPDALTGLDAAISRGRPVTLISGPSTTSDIELDRVEGVHGPRRLTVVLVPNWTCK